MNLFEIIKNAPETSQLITDSIVITHSKLQQYNKILCSVSGGSDSDILIDLCQKFDDANKITYAFFDTGLEFRATKEHIEYLENRYNIHIECVKAIKPIPSCCKKYGQPFISKQVSEWIERLQRHNFKWEDKPFEELYKQYPNCRAALRWWCNDFQKAKNGKESDQNINYQIRPSKSIERKMMCELVKEIQIIQGTSELRYIGMGAKYFTDFLLFHNEFGVTDMISIEAERERAMRYEFNKPLKSIQMIYGTTNEVLPQIDQFEEKMNLVWLDYDGAFSEGMLSDIETLCRRLYVGSMFFISCNYSFAGKASEKRSAFEKSVGDYFEPDIEKSRYTNNGIPLIIQELINNLILKVLEKRNRSDSSRNVQYMQLLFLKYKDGAPMLTIGGILVDDELKNRIINSNILQKLIYCSRDNECFNIEVPKLTYKEIQLVLREIPITDKEYEDNKERFHGIGLDEIRKFEKIYRYYPYYTEGCLNT